MGEDPGAGGTVLGSLGLPTVATCGTTYVASRLRLWGFLQDRGGLVELNALEFCVTTGCEIAPRFGTREGYGVCHSSLVERRPSYSESRAGFFHGDCSFLGTYPAVLRLSLFIDVGGERDVFAATLGYSSAFYAPVRARVRAARQIRGPRTGDSLAGVVPHNESRVHEISFL
jgi:hypothetical protein